MGTVSTSIKTKTFIDFDTLVRLFLMGSFVFYMTNVKGTEPYEIYIQYSAMFFLFASFFYAPVRAVTSKWLGVFALYVLLHTILFKFDVVARKALLNVALGILTIRVICERTDLDFKKYGVWMFWFLVLNALWIWGFQERGVDPVYSSSNAQYMPQADKIGLVQFAHVLGAIAAFSVPLLFSWNPLACVAVLPALFYGKSSTCVVGAVLAFMFLMWFRSRKLFLALSLALLGFGVWYVQRDSIGGEFHKRIDVWMTGLHYWKDYIWFGYGLGSWKMIEFVGFKQNGQPEVWSWAHNEFLQIGFEVGLAGLFMVGAYLSGFLKEMSISKNKEVFALLGVLFIVSFFHFPFHLGKLAGISLVVLAFAEAARADGKIKA